MTTYTSGTALTEVSVRGSADEELAEYARRRIEKVLAHIGEPVGSVQIKMSLAPDPARERPALAQAVIDIDGTRLRAHVAAADLREAVDLLQHRLLDRMEQRASHLRALRRRGAGHEAGEWRHGDQPTHRPAYYDRPVEDRRLVSQKSFELGDLTVDEAAFDMEQLDHDFHLFRDRDSGLDAVLERVPDGSYRMTRLRPVIVDATPIAIALTVAEHPAPTASVTEAIARLDTSGEPFVFFADRTSGRGSVVYRRFDGHYGLISSE